MGSAFQELNEARVQLPDDLVAASTFVDLLYALDTEGFTDTQFERLEDLIEDSIRVLDRSPEPQARVLMERLAEALIGVRAGLPPNPKSRPSRAELEEQFERDLREMDL